jgi:hypothetical protein
MDFSDIVRLIPSHLHDRILAMSAQQIADIITAFYNMTDTKHAQTPCIIVPSATIGAIGESAIRELICDKYDVTDTSKLGKAGDFIIVIDGFRILVEVKRYTRTVPGSELEKFYRDIEFNNIHGGLMISMTSKIVGVSRSMEYTHKYVVGTEIPIVYLTLKDMTQSATRSCIYAAIDIMVADMKNSNSVVDMKHNISRIVGNIETNVNHLSNCRLIVQETQEMFSKQMTKLVQHMLSVEINIKNSANLLKVTTEGDDIGRGGYEEVDAILQTVMSQFDLSAIEIKMLSIILGKIGPIILLKNTISNEKKNVFIKLFKTNIQVSISTTLTNTLSINGPWSYNGKLLTVKLDEGTFDVILDMISTMHGHID